MKLPKTPKIVYKYHKVNEYLNSLIDDSCFWFSDKKSINEYNDSFDLEYDVTDKHADEMCELYHFMPLDKEERRLEMRNRLKSFNTHGICSFTESSTNEYMWSLYATNLGVCMGFDTNILGNIFKVKYTNKPVIINSYKQTYKVFLTKGLIYKKEQEWRLTTFKIFGKVRFNKKALVKITFGRLVNDSECNRIIEKLKSNGYEFESFKIKAKNRILIEELYKH